MTVDEIKQYIPDRITTLRMEKDISEYEMSKALGKSPCYIQGISSGKALPSMDGFLHICEYLEVSPGEFFNLKEEPTPQDSLLHLAEQLPEDRLSLLIRIGNAMLEETPADFEDETPIG